MDSHAVLLLFVPIPCRRLEYKKVFDRGKSMQNKTPGGPKEIRTVGGI